jgi:preprotein translocase subunit SecD
VLGFNGEDDVDNIEQRFPSIVQQFIEWLQNFDPANIHKEIFEMYSAKNITKQLAALLDTVV